MDKKDVSKFLRVSLKTVDRYVKTGKLSCWKNRVNGRLYYDREQVLRLLGSGLPQSREVWIYCRASPLPSLQVSVDRRLQEQVDRVLGYCAAAGVRVDRVVRETGRAADWKGRGGLDEIMEAVLKKRVSCLVVETADRLGRFAGHDMFESFLLWHGVELHVIHETLPNDEYRLEIKDDLADLILRARALIGES
jgi:predicted site-specific integrase-resolvase